MKLDGMDSARARVQWIGRILPSLALAAVAGGCATVGGHDQAAPRSQVSRRQALVLAEQFATSIGGKAFAIAPSGSMRPTLDESSIVTVERVSLQDLQRGDIVVYRNAAGAAVIHRLFERHDQEWFVLGDNNATIDHETVNQANLVGRVCAIFYTRADPASLANEVDRQTSLALASH